MDGDCRTDWADIPANFWWAEGHSALEQNWKSGDFSTWIKQERHLQAFGVSFALSGLLEMVDFVQRPIVARKLSVAGDPDWIAAKDARRIVRESKVCDPIKAGSFILEQGRLGFVAARAVSLEGAGSQPEGKTSWVAREWDVPDWYWEDYTGSELRADWDLGRLSGYGRGKNGTMHLTLSGVHFHRASIETVAGIVAVSEPSVRPPIRKPKYDWEAAANAVWGGIYRGELIPDAQTAIERFMQEFLRKGDEEPSESTVRPHARSIWKEFAKEADS